MQVLVETCPNHTVVIHKYAVLLQEVVQIGVILLLPPFVEENQQGSPRIQIRVQRIKFVFREHLLRRCEDKQVRLTNLIHRYFLFIQTDFK